MAPEPVITAPPIRGKRESPGKQEARNRARRKQWIDDGVEKLTAEYMEKAGGDFNKAARFWFDREERKRQLPWPGLEEGEAFIENMKEDILDPRQLQLQMEMEEGEKEEQEQEARKRRYRRFARGRGPGGSNTALEASLVNSERRVPASEQPEAQQKAAYDLATLTTLTKTVANPDPLLAASSALQSVEMLSTPLTNTSLSLSLPGKQVLPSDRRKRRRKTEVKNLDLGEGWAASVTDKGHRSCVKHRREDELE
ncbi:hypothetical protein CIB48_g10419 [Xylaria polymorpha]|nr:hypothetical protein CIB48_g10419 [Xylaria polymorpha]